MTRAWLLGLVLALTSFVPLAGAADAEAATWYVRAGATAGAGTTAAPFGTLAQVESRSRAGDTIVVLPAVEALDGGLQLKPGQTVRGVAGTGGKAPRVTNTTTRLSGDAIRLANGTTVRGLTIVGPARGAIYGDGVTGVRIVGNDVSGHNTSCAKGFLIPPFNAPTNIPGVGIPISGGLQNGWAGIGIDAGSGTGLTASIVGNVVHDATCGDGIDVRYSGTASGSVVITGNRVHTLEQGPAFKSVLAIGLQSRDSARLTATITGNEQADLGNPDDLDLGPEGVDSEGIFLNAVDGGRLDTVVRHNTYTNERGLGGFSANGLEMVSMGSGSRMSTLVTDSSFSGSPGDVIEEGALGTDAVLTMRLERVVVERSTGIGNTWILPFNNGDCVLAGSLGARNTVRLTVRDSVLRNCSNNGLSIGSNVVNGKGPTTELSLDVADTVITGNRGGNLAVRNFTRLERLKVKVQRSNLQLSTGFGSSVSDLAVEDLGTTSHAVIDLGGGALGSEGRNCIDGGALSADVVRYDVSARSNWWGQPSGPAPLQTLVIGGSLDTARPLTTPPEWCPSS
jgi:hypothetical protein